MRPNHLLVGLLLLVGVSAVATTAGADVVGPPPRNCPPGSGPVMLGHGSWVCLPQPCEQEGPCPEDPVAGILGGGVPGPSTCQETALCIARSTVSQGGSGGLGNVPSAPPVHVAVGVCGEGDACDQGTCSRAMRCVAVAVPPVLPAEPRPEPAAPDPEAAPARSPPTATTDADRGGCGCAAPGRDAPSSHTLLGSIAALVVLRLGRRRAA